MIRPDCLSDNGWHEEPTTWVGGPYQLLTAPLLQRHWNDALCLRLQAAKISLQFQHLQRGIHTLLIPYKEVKRGSSGGRILGQFKVRSLHHLFRLRFTFNQVGRRQLNIRVKISLICPPIVREFLSSSVSPSNSLISISDPWRAFWADTAPFKGPQLASCIASGNTEIQEHH